MVGFGFIIPLIPDYISSFGGAPALAGILMASYAVGQFFAAPIVGRLSDRFGRKPLFLFSIGGTFLSLLLLGLAPSLPFIFASRILDGLTGGNITVAQSYIVDITDDKNRAKGFGIIGMAFGFGFIIGPLFGGLLSRFGLSTPAFVAAGIAATNLLLISIILPESLSAERAWLAAGVSSTMLRTLLTKSVPKEASGGTLGLAASIDSLNRILAPLTGGLLLALLGPRTPGLVAEVLAAFTAWFGWRRLVNEDCLSMSALPGACDA